MAKSLRSKAKRSFRSKKRQSGKYAAAEAARLNRLNAKLVAVKEMDRPVVAPLDTAEGIVEEDQPEEPGTVLFWFRGEEDGLKLIEVADSDERRSFRDKSLMYTNLLGAVSDVVEDGEGMALDEPERSDEKPKSVSTHGPRGSRREEWRKSKGMDPIPKRHGINRQGGLAARRKAGRPSRRR